MKKIFFSGMFTGTILTFPIAGILADSTFLGGWPSIFYVCGISLNIQLKL